MADSLDLGLTEEQVAAVTEIRDTLVAQHQRTANDLRVELEGQDMAGDPRAMMSLIRPSMQEANDNVRHSLEMLEEILSDEQWDKLPEEVREPRGALGGGQRRRPRGLSAAVESNVRHAETVLLVGTESATPERLRGYVYDPDGYRC